MEVRLRPWRIEDAPAVAEMMNNPHILKNLRDGIPYPYTRSDGETFIRGMLQADPNRTFAFAVTADSRVVGSVGIFRQGNIHFRTAELGYYIAEPFWGRRIGTQAVRLACRTVLKQTDILRIFAEPFANNTGSCRVLEKSGFVLEGTMKKNAFKAGRVLDMRLYALTCGESN